MLKHHQLKVITDHRYNKDPIENPNPGETTISVDGGPNNSVLENRILVDSNPSVEVHSGVVQQDIGHLR